MSTQIIQLDDPRLKQISTPVTEFGPHLTTLIEKMFEVMETSRGIGLAAVQIGILTRIIVTDAPDAEGTRHRMALINPVITFAGSEVQETQEGCLSIPGVRLDVKRPSFVTAEYHDYLGVLQQVNATGLFAACLQHEIDHLDGKLILDHVSRLKRDRAKALYQKYARRNAA